MYLDVYTPDFERVAVIEVINSLQWTTRMQEPGEISLEELAAKCLVSKYYLSHLFTKSTGKSIGRYILDKRMYMAKYLLSSTDLSVEQVSTDCGFSDSAYFCRLFKNTIGTTATEYLNFVRLCKAETMLKNGASISDASYRAGFSSLSYFNRIFKKYKHYTPSEFRKIIKHQEFDYSSENAI